VAVTLSAFCFLPEPEKLFCVLVAIFGSNGLPLPKKSVIPKFNGNPKRFVIPALYVFVFEVVVVFVLLAEEDSTIFTITMSPIVLPL